MDEKFQIIEEVITMRRTVKPAKMNGRIIEVELFNKFLEGANWAPTHGNTEPIKFFIINPDSVKKFCKLHAEMYKEFTSADVFSNEKYDKILNNGNNVSHIIGLGMKRGNNKKIPEIEEIASVACSVQNIMLLAHSAGIVSYWGSGGMTYKPEMKKYFNLNDEDKFLGFLYLGYTDQEPQPGKRVKPMKEKFVNWEFT
ncbi:MAG TPA: nitroreductase [Bacteroidetes bacterium]|nr:nitroreductase [Bacteroidota bacterium]HCN37911.1 nitroreductase [Bacteroidota bacterium]